MKEFAIPELDSFSLKVAEIATISNPDITEPTETTSPGGGNQTPPAPPRG